MARAKQPRLDSPRKITAPEKTRDQRHAELTEQQRQRRLFAPRLGWGGRFGGRAAVEDTGTVYTGPSTQAAGMYPFLLGAGLPPRGVPVGRDVLTGELVCLDPAGWVGKLTTNPNVWIMSQPGAGKSALVKRMLLFYCAFGFMPVIPGDVKGEYTVLVRQLGGSVVQIGDGVGRLNPLDSGPLKNRLHLLGTVERDNVLDILNSRRLETLGALLSTKHGLGRTPDEIQRSALTCAVQIAADACPGEDPIVPDVITVLRQAPDQLKAKLAAHRDMYQDLTRSVIAGLENLCSGPLKGLFDGPTTQQLDVDATAVSVDISRLRARGTDTISAGMIATWAYAYSSIDSARSTGLMSRRLILPMDEMWRALRSGPGLVDSMDSIGRLARGDGDITLYITHSLLDTEALPTEEDRAKARGLMDRCDTWVIGASSAEELTRVTGKRELTEQERMMIASWSSATSTGLDTGDAVHPGRGKYMIKVGTRPGIAAASELTATEAKLYHTDPTAGTDLG
ncbi:ATP-binding protein [Streptomyces sp. CB00316]|uniref:ATP-binding protein n=1 Tax=Streptomyces sp. CB00316 TaxID=1703932 RepID=UPI0009393AE9|nr:ATP-binding protein [Streptomyces sp. CB00316]OKJ10644.1 ATP-binding protein [Streptomyces sp. CB00316]